MQRDIVGLHTASESKLQLRLAIHTGLWFFRFARHDLTVDDTPVDRPKTKSNKNFNGRTPACMHGAVWLPAGRQERVLLEGHTLCRCRCSTRGTRRLAEGQGLDLSTAGGSIFTSRRLVAQGARKGACSLALLWARRPFYRLFSGLYMPYLLCLEST